MAATLILLSICIAGVAFLLYVLVALSRETRPPAVSRPESEERTRIVVPLPPDPIITIQQFRPAGAPENAPFLIVSNSGIPSAEFYVDEPTELPSLADAKRTHVRAAK